MNRLLMTILLCGVGPLGLATERHVPGQYRTIQEAIDASQNGDVVLVQPGKYAETIRFRGKAITVRAAETGGWEGVGWTVIRGSKDGGSCVIFDQGETHESVLEGFVLSGGSGSTVDSETGSFLAGGGVLCIDSSPTITRCLITRNRAPYGGGIAMFGNSQARIVNCAIVYNFASTLGGAILIRKDVEPPTGWSSGRLRVGSTGSSIAALEAGSGPAIINCTISDNVTEASRELYGYDVDCWDTRPTIMNTIIYGSGRSLLIADSALVSYSCIREIYLFGGSYENSSAIADFSGLVKTSGGFPGFAPLPREWSPTWEYIHQEYRLDAASPYVNAGNPAALAYGRLDINGRPRIMGAGIDIGAYEVTPELVVTSPVSGDIWTAGSARTVRWNGLLHEGTVDLLFSGDGGESRSVLAEALPNTGSYVWELPVTVDSHACVVYVVPHVADANVALVDSGLFTIHPDSAGPSVASKWLSLGGDFRRTGLNEEKGPDGARVKWTFEAPAAVVASVTVGFDGRVHIACEDGSLHTLDTEGRPLWAWTTDSAAVSAPTLGPDGSLFVGSEGGALHAIAKYGKTRWTFRTGGPIYSSPAVASDGGVYVGSADGTVYALSNGGAELWRFETKGPGLRPSGAVFASPALGIDGAVYVAGLYDPNLYALDAADGSIRWVCSFDPSSHCFASPVVAEDGTIYLALLGDRWLHAIEPSAGGIIWSVDLTDPAAVGEDGQGLRLNGEVWSEPVLGPDGTVYVSTGDPYLRAVHPDGYIKWAKRLGEAGGFTLTVDRHGFVYAAGEDGYVYSVSPEGVQIDRLALGGRPGFPVIAAEDLLIVADSSDYSLLVTDQQNTVWAISSQAMENEP